MANQLGREARVHPYQDHDVHNPDLEQVLAEHAHSLGLYITKELIYDLRQINDSEFIDQHLNINELAAELLKEGAERRGSVPIVVDFQRSLPSRRVDLTLRSAYHDLDVLFSVNPAPVSGSAFESPLRATISGSQDHRRKRCASLGAARRQSST